MSEFEVPKGTVLGHYRVTLGIGAGTLGDVYRGVEIMSGREAAVKVLRRALAADPERVRQFRAEHEGVSRLSHASIIAIYEAGEQGGWHYYTMQLLEQGTLAQLIASEGALPRDRALKLIEEVVQAIYLAHRKELVHRALTPSTVRFDGRGCALVTDLGVIRDVPEGYVPPEVATGGAWDVRSDLYQVGALLAEMLTGRPWRPGDAPGERPGIPGELGQLVARAIAADPGARFQSAKELLVELNRLKPPSAPPEPVAEPAQQPAPAAPMVVRAFRALPAHQAASREQEQRPIIGAPRPGPGAMAEPARPVSPGQATAVLNLQRARRRFPGPRVLVPISAALLVAVAAAIVWLVPYMQESPKVLGLTKEVQTHQARIQFSTHIPCFTSIEYWPVGSIHATVRLPRSPVAWTFHGGCLGGLKPDTTYNFRLLLARRPGHAGPVYPTEVFEFTTRPEIQIFNVHVEEHPRTAVITWETNLRTDSRVAYGRTDRYGDECSNLDQRSETIHQVTLEGLAPDTVYHARIAARDPRSAGPLTYGNDLKFQTTPLESEASTTRPDDMVNLTNFYVEKLTRMTSDERDELKRASIRSRPRTERPAGGSSSSPRR